MSFTTFRDHDKQVAVQVSKISCVVKDDGDYPTHIYFVGDHQPVKIRLSFKAVVEALQIAAKADSTPTSPTNRFLDIAEEI